MNQKYIDQNQGLQHGSIVSNWKEVIQSENLTEKGAQNGIDYSNTHVLH